MPEDSRAVDAEIIRVGYADRVKEAFKVFAESLGMGQAEKASQERFIRSLDLARKARDMALASLGEEPAVIEPSAPHEQAEGAPQPAAEDARADGLSAEVRAMIEHAVEQTQGTKTAGQRR